MALTKAPEELLDKSLTSALTITTADNTTQLTLTSTDDDASIGPRMDLTRDSSSPAASDTLGGIRFIGEDDADNSHSYVHMIAYIEDPADGAEDGKFEIDTRVAGSMRSRLLIHSTSTVFNQEGQDVNFRVESDGNANMLFVDGGNDRVGVGIGTPNETMHVHQTSTPRIMFTDGTTGTSSNSDGMFIGIAGDQGFNLWNYEDTYTRFAVNNVERVRINNSGALLNGTTSVPTGVQMGSQIVSSSVSGAEIIAFRADTSVAAGNKCGAFLIGNSDTSGTEDHFVGMWGKVSSTNGSQDLHFAAGRSGYEDDAPTFTINSDGMVQIGRGSGTTDYGFDLYHTGHLYMFVDGSGNTEGFRLYDASGTLKASIQCDGDYVDHSDENYKSNITDSSSVLSTIANIKVRSFNWKDDGRKQSYGFIAQELKDVAPEVTKVPEEEGDMWGVKTSKIVPMLVKAIQEQQTLIETLQTKVKALEEA